MKKLHLQLLGGLGALALISSSAFAQYVWINDKGVKQFSDKPPPTSVPRSKILKAPHMSSLKNSSTVNEESSTPEKSNLTELEKLEKPKTVANKNEDFNKRKQEREEAEKKSLDEQKLKAENQKQCERAKSYQRSLEGGVVITSTNKKGERIILNEAQRAQELADAKKTTSECK